MSLNPKSMAGKRESQSGPRYGYHGDKAGTCHRTEVGAKIQSPKIEGMLIVADNAGFYWRRDMTRVYDDERVVATRVNGKWVKTGSQNKPWTKNNRNKWTWNEDPEFTVKIYKYDGMRFYGADVWWHGHSAEIDGASTRGDIDYLVQEFLKKKNPREYFEHDKRYVLEEIGYKKEGTK